MGSNPWLRHHYIFLLKNKSMAIHFESQFLALSDKLPHCLVTVVWLRCLLGGKKTQSENGVFKFLSFKIL
jgi:hypothetical protein